MTSDHDLGDINCDVGLIQFSFYFPSNLNDIRGVNIQLHLRVGHALIIGSYNGLNEAKLEASIVSALSGKVTGQ